MRLKQLYPRVYFLKFSNQYELTMTMIRLQEFYESPYRNIRGKHFSLEEFMDTYARAKGNFTYCTDWNGFNVPSIVIQDFFIMFHPLRKREKALLNKIKHLFSDRQFYLIAGHDDSVIHHEMAHGLFTVDTLYRTRMLSLIKEMPKDFIVRFKKGLKKEGYCSQVYLDEIQAYAVDNIVSKQNQLEPMEFKPGDMKLCRRFYKIFKEYYPV